ncbi:MAG: acyl-[acyl-carrier-protein] thioesterase [Candidatus Goldiibacteriota bacterium]
MEDLSVYRFETKVDSSDADAGGRAKLTALMKYFQDAAWAHYKCFERKGGRVLDAGTAWVVSKANVGIERMPIWEEELVVATWLPGFEGFYPLRNFEIKTAGGALIARAAFAWLIINTAEKKPVRPGEFAKIWPIKETGILRSVKGRVEKPENPEIRGHFKVKYSDIDVNGHANNTGYIKWMLDCYDYEFILENEPKELIVNFARDCVWGDEVDAGFEAVDGALAAFRHNIINTNTGRELCRAKLLWKKSPR